ncbi:hypothetical protein COCC4DRAFT_56729 [Bipolaris maydis ATCC 48331]|uniref:Uncharacterized protein n=1 Tax=Cochliobolus heterostrophus (strain C4 / ATCC 48331 / race T) TaxID=665024 RepID=N4XVK6_COCH4|nr:uncharacterized protein COCC4DRAFT_56729 [Bipolaris maydis ATCC 48331]ENI09207.1 hypothetical protein COCC4DRAFT_56729 [Bipolaris maydis ATCC 48331]
MTSANSYSGPMALENSKYATPLHKKSSSFTSTPFLSPVATPKSSGTTAIEQHNSDVQLAIAHGNSLYDEVNQHAAKLSTVISSTIANTRHLLNLIREASPETSSATTEALWSELEKLYTAMNDAKAALPKFLDKQRNNISLYHTAMMNQMIQDTQNELNIQHKKVNIQHDLILEHHEAFHAYKEQTAAKIKDIEALQERVSRLTLEKGNLRTEVDKYMQLLEKEHATKAEDLRKADTMQKELETVTASNKQLLIEIDALRQKLEEHQGKAKADQQSTEELKLIADQLAEEKKKTAALMTKIADLGEIERIARLDADKARKEHKTLSEKYSNQAAEHAKAFTVCILDWTIQMQTKLIHIQKLKEQSKEIEGLKNDIGRLQKENTELQQRLAKLTDMDHQVTKLDRENVELSGLVSSLTSQLKAAQDEVSNTRFEKEALSKKVESLSKAGKPADSDTADLVHKQAEKIAVLENTLEEWTELAKRSYKEYKEMLPTYKQAEQYRKYALDREETIKGLQKELIAAKASQNNGDTTYWKNKIQWPTHGTMDPVSWSCYINVHQAIPRGLGNKLDARLCYVGALQKGQVVDAYASDVGKRQAERKDTSCSEKPPQHLREYTFRTISVCFDLQCQSECQDGAFIGCLFDSIQDGLVDLQVRCDLHCMCTHLGRGREEGKVWTPNFPLDGGVACGGPWARRPSIASAMVGRRTKSVCPARPWTHRMDSARPPSEATDKGLGCKGARELVQDEDQVWQNGASAADRQKLEWPGGAVASASGACKIACRRYACMPFHTDIKAC